MAHGGGGVSSAALSQRTAGCADPEVRLSTLGLGSLREVGGPGLGG